MRLYADVKNTFRCRYSSASRTFSKVKNSFVCAELNSRFKIEFSEFIFIVKYSKFEEIEYFIDYGKFEMWQTLYYVSSRYFQQ